LSAASFEKKAMFASEARQSTPLLGIARASTQVSPQIVRARRSL
jgi:hypothetical protein